MREHSTIRGFSASRHKLPAGVLCIFLVVLFTLHAGDILRGGISAAAAQRNAAAREKAGQDAANIARINAQDRLARTTQAITAIRALQQQARSIVDTGNVPDGLQTGGLQVATGTDARWDGADAPEASGSNIVIHQNAEQAILHWQTFNVGKNTTVTFDQSAGGTDVGKWIAFNKIFDPSGSPSKILGSINAQGQVYILNQNGIIFSTGSQVNVHTLVASSIPINDNLIDRGLLNNPDAQFLFTTTPLPAGSNGTPAFNPPAPLTPSGRPGDVIVEQGAHITSSETSENTGGRVMLVAPNVRNDGTISTPDGQTILAAGLQVGINAHDSSNASLRGLDVYVGSVGSYGGTVINTGLIEAYRGSAIMTGKDVQQLGAIDSSTSVTFNGRIDLLANYDAIKNSNYTATDSSSPPYWYQTSGNVTIGAGSVTRILPEWDSTEKVVGTQLALQSQINMQGKTIYVGNGGMIQAPSGSVAFNAGTWIVSGSISTAGVNLSSFAYNDGQIYLETNSFIDVAGSTDVFVPLAESILTLELRGSEFANSPLQRGGAVRGVPIKIDVRRKGAFAGQAWVGTPLGDASGFVGLIERTVGELTASGGTVQLQAGNSIIMKQGSLVDVSGGWLSHEGGQIQTTRLTSGGRIIDIGSATPDIVYDGVFTGMSASTHAKWGITENFSLPLAPTGAHYDPGYIEGANAGKLSITAPSMALDGDMQGVAVIGPRQLRENSYTSNLPVAGQLQIAFKAQDISFGTSLPYYSPTPPHVTFQSDITLTAPASFSLDVNGNPIPLSADRVSTVVLSPDLLKKKGFGSLTVDNSDGDITIPAGITLSAPQGGSIILQGANIDIQGSVLAPGGTLAFTAYSYTPFRNDRLLTASPPPTPGRGNFTLGSQAILSAAGLIVDDRITGPEGAPLPMEPGGGNISIAAYNVNLSKGGKVDVSGGLTISSRNKKTYGDAGGIVINAGQDPNPNLTIIGGQLNLQAALLAYSGATGGSLSLQAQMIQIGGSSPDYPNTLLLQPEFFSTGGFSQFSLTGIGSPTGTPDKYLPAIVIKSGTIIQPVIESRVAAPNAGKTLMLIPADKPVGLRSPVSLAFNAPGAAGKLGDTKIITRGDIVMEAGSVIRTDPLAAVSFKGQTVSISGTVIAPGGEIDISGASQFPSLNLTTFALPTVYIGSQAFLSTAGMSLYVPDPFHLLRGEILPGGTISVAGNILAAAGAVLDVSGSSGMMDLTPAELGMITSPQVPLNSGVNAPLNSVNSTPMRLDSDAGTINFAGSELLITNASLIGRAGGPAALGGNLNISSGRFYPGPAKTTADINLIVTQDSQQLPNANYPQGVGLAVRDASGAILTGMGYFAVSDFQKGGFDTLALGGNVQFSGSVTINAARKLSVASGGVITADSKVSLSAPYVVLGQPFITPILPQDQGASTSWLFSQFDNQGTQTEYKYPLTSGGGILTVSAKLLDVGTLVLQNIGRAEFDAPGGDIRGVGTLSIAGDLTLLAAQIYPATGLSFNIFAYDHGGIPGSVTIIGAGDRRLPLSGGGQLNIYGTNITQGGVLRSPLGSINLGWDGTGTAPINNAVTLAAPVTQQLTLAAGSVTSVSGVDPMTGTALYIPYGISPDGISWIDPSGTDISASGPPAKQITLSGVSLTTEKGSLIDISGGGDLFAYRWIKGTGGTTDILASSNSFAVIPGYGDFFAPYSPFNSASTATSFNSNNVRDPGYVNTGLSVGDSVYLGASSGLPAGVYTLLPARYALIPGAFLVTPQSGSPVGTVQYPDGSSTVSGYRYNTLNSQRTVSATNVRFEVLSSAVINSRSEYQLYSANDFFGKSAAALGVAVPRLPNDAGQLILEATQAMKLSGSVSAKAAMGGKGAFTDISSPVNILISDGTVSAPAGTLILNAADLSAFNAESLLIGGVRSTSTAGVTITPRTSKITVDNRNAVFESPEIILASLGEINFAQGASMGSSGSLSNPAETLLLTGDGTLARVSGDSTASILRTGVTTATTASMTIASGVKISGSGIILDSSYATSMDPSVSLIGDAISLNSGQISVELNNPGALQPTAGLVLNGNALQTFENTQFASLLSYSSIDFYGTGQFGAAGMERLTLHAGEIRGFNQGAGVVQILAKEIYLDNASGGRVIGAVAAQSGTLGLSADVIHIGKNQMSVSQYTNLLLNANHGIIGEGTGGLTTLGSMTVTSPMITAGSAAVQSLGAAGVLTLQKPAGGGGVTVEGGLGANYTFTGAGIVENTDISLPSGLLTLHATTGDISVGGSLSVEGTSEAFYDLIKYTDAGQITLTADAGSVLFNAGSHVSVAANATAGNAGVLSITAANNIVTSGVFSAGAAAGWTSGSFLLDVGNLPALSAISSALDAGGFMESRSFRVRNSSNVLIDGTSTARNFSLSADQGSITVQGTIDAGGVTGGSITLIANKSVILQSGSVLTVAAQEFSDAGKGGSIDIEAGAERNGIVDTTALLDIQTGSLLNLSVAAQTANSGFYGQFSGTVHLRAPQNAAGTEIQINTISGEIRNASSILVEGYKIFDLTETGGVITNTGTTQATGGIIADTGVNVEGSIFANGTTFGNASSAISNRLIGGTVNSGLSSTVVVAPGAEILNRAAPSTLPVTLNTSGTSSVSLAASIPVTFASGLAGNNIIRASASGVIKAANGTTTTFAANASLNAASLPAGSTITLNSAGSLTFLSGTGGAIQLSVPPGGVATTGATGTASAVSAVGSMVKLNTSGTSGVTLAANSAIAFLAATNITSTVAGTITRPDGSTVALAANTSTAITVGSKVTLSSSGNITRTGNVTTVSLLAGSFTTIGATDVTAPSGNLSLGSLTSTFSSDWDLSTYRFGPKNAPGVLTMRAAGNLLFYNALSDGFTLTGSTGTSLWMATLSALNTSIPVNTQSWSYRLTAGADISAVDFHKVKPVASLSADMGSLLLGKNYGQVTVTGGANATTSTAVSGNLQIIRTGTGDIDISAGRDVRLLNQFATIYTAGVRVPDYTTIYTTGDFTVPNVVKTGPTQSAELGILQQLYAPQYSMAGGNVTIGAQINIGHYTLDSDKNLIADSSRQLPVNWLYRRGLVDPVSGDYGTAGVTGSIAISVTDSAASTTWWVDFSNFFEGIGALGGGNVTLLAGNDISNIDAAIPTNARAPKGTPDASMILELGGGDLIVKSGHDIDAGVYYVERGRGTLFAGNSIKTNSTRSPSLGALTSANFIADSNTWLPTTLFLGKGTFDVSARGNILLGPTTNPFLLPQGLDNRYWYKTYFNTFSSDSAVDVVSLGGNIQYRLNATPNGQNDAVPILQTWMAAQNLLNRAGNTSANYQPWIRLLETDLNPFNTAFSIMAPTLRSTAFSGDISITGTMNLFPSPSGTVELAAAGAIIGLNPTGVGVFSSKNLISWMAATINLSDSDPSALPGVTTPYAYRNIVGSTAGLQNLTTNNANLQFLSFWNQAFAESGSYMGNQASIQSKQSRHAAGLLHAGDSQPLKLYASSGNIESITLFSAKAAQIFAGQDITDIGFYLQNVGSEDVSIVTAGRDIVAYNANAPFRSITTSTGNTLATSQSVLSGDIQINGPGALEVLAGRHLDLGTGANNLDGTGVGITSIGNSRNPYLPFEGASLIIGAGIGPSTGLSGSSLDFDSFIDGYLKQGDIEKYLTELDSQSGITSLDNLPKEQRDRLAMQLFYLILRDAGREHATSGSYGKGIAAIEALFDKTTNQGDINTRSRDIRTKSGGYIDIFAPSGKLTLASSLIGNPLAPPGIVTESGGNISIFTKGSVDIGLARIFTLKGGNIVIWSSEGDIAAGSSAKTVQSAPPTRVLIDPQSGDVQTDLAGLATGGGIGVLATLGDVEPGDVDLIAPNGNVDAGDAGIRVSGNLNIAAVKVLNADNIAVTGTSGGVPTAAAVSAPNVSGLSSASNSTAATSDVANQVANQSHQKPQEAEPPPSLITVEVLGYGGGDDDDHQSNDGDTQKKDEEKKRKANSASN